MLEKLWEFFFKPNEKDGKNKRQNLWMSLSLLGMLGILLILWGNITAPKEPPRESYPTEGEAVPVFNTTDVPASWEVEMEQNLERILSFIEGVGRVEVEITLEKGKEYQYVFDSSISESQTNENDKSGGTRTITDSSTTRDLVILRGNDGNEKPVLLYDIAPIIKGVLIVAEGAENPQIVARLTRAVNTVLQVDFHKICILPYKR